MKQRLFSLLSICTILSLLWTSLPVVSAQNEIIGTVESTDIVAVIDGQTIPSYLVNGYLVVFVSDLNAYGLQTSYDNNTRTSTVKASASSASKVPMPTKLATGNMAVYRSNILVSLNGTIVDGFNIDNRMAVRFSDLKVFGTYAYNNTLRKSSLTLASASQQTTTPSAQTPQEKPLQGTAYHIHQWKAHEQTTVTQDYTVRKNAPFSYHLTSAIPNDLRIEYTLSVKPETTYVVQVDCKTKNVVNHENTSDPVGATITISNYEYSQSLMGTSDWQTLSLIGQSDKDGKLTLSMNLGYWGNICTGEAWFENIRYTPVTEFKTEDPTWKFLAVILTDTSLSVPEENLQLSYKMGESEITEITNALGRFEKDLAHDSAGLIQAKVDVIVADAKFHRYTKSEAYGYKVKASDANAYCKENNIDFAGYDHVIFILCQPGMEADYYGLGGTFISGYTGFSFVKFSSKDFLLRIMSPNSTWSSAIFVHEFMHSAESYSRVLGYEHAYVDKGASYGYSGEDEWRRFLSDFMQKKLPYENRYVGIDPVIWSIPPRIFS